MINNMYYPADTARDARNGTMQGKRGKIYTAKRRAFSISLCAMIAATSSALPPLLARVEDITEEEMKQPFLGHIVARENLVRGHRILGELLFGVE
jgi:hypothetical protein